MVRSTEHKRNLFEVDNARNLSKVELVKTFVPTQSFWRLLSAKHHIILGSRGSGKTALAKMLSHTHLALLKDERARSAVKDQQFIGIYVPTHLEWVGGLKNKPWQSEQEQELLFQWRLNITTCMAFIPVVKSCIETYVPNKGQQARLEKDLSIELSKAWLNERLYTLDRLYRSLSHVDLQKRMQLAQIIARKRPSEEFPQVGVIFDTDLFYPLREAINSVSDILKLRRDCTWLVCLDEAEFLEELHHRILNSHMRAHSGNLFFKITTMPYSHHTLQTNTRVSLDVGDDFEYVNIDADPTLFARTDGESQTIGTQFARAIFNKRAETSVQSIKRISVQDLLGDSLLLDEKNDDWKPNSHEMRLLKSYCTQKTILRANRLLGSAKFKQEISRKIHGTLLLREEYEKVEGNYKPGIYSGVTLAIRCGDSNPRRIIKIFNALLLATTNKKRRATTGPRRRHSILTPKEQTRVLRKFSETLFNYVQSEPEYGLRLFAFLKLIGEYLSSHLHNKKMSTDQVSAIEIDQTISDDHWEIVKCAVERSYLCPKIGPDNPDYIPQKEGVFHFANGLAPHFFLLPRRGKAHKLSSILKARGEAGYSNDLPLFREKGPTDDR